MAEEPQCFSVSKQFIPKETPRSLEEKLQNTVCRLF